MIFFEGVAGKLLPDAASRRTGAIYKNLTFHLGAGCHAIGGPTTDPQAARLLLELAAGHVRASRGKVRILTHAPGSAKVSADVVYVPRDVVLPEELTALAVVALDGKARGRANGANGAKGASAAADPAARLAALGLGDLAKRPVRTLSLPERRGVALAIAVTCGAKILLL